MTTPQFAPIAKATRGRACEQCGTEIAAALLSCPSCHALVHGRALTQLSTEAKAAEQSGDLSTALATWRSALDLLPPETEQHAVIAAHTSDLALQVDGQPVIRPAKARSALGRAWGAVGTGVILVLSKAKLLLLGLTKLSTLTSMLLFLGVYWQFWGWKFALGFVLCIYIHEMGHVAALTRYGIAAHAPMFIPGFGALVRLKQYPSDPRQDARVGLAGPIWGLGAGLAAYGLSLAFHAPVLAGIARSAGFLNLFNLIPVWQLDGARGFHSLNRVQRWVVVAVLLGGWALSSNGWLLIMAVAGVFKAFARDAPQEPDKVSIATYVLLVAALTWLSAIPVPLTPLPAGR